MPTVRETILTALQTRLSALAAPALRGEVLPERMPADGLLILRDGEPWEPEATLSPRAWHYRHRAEVEAIVACHRVPGQSHAVKGRAGKCPFERRSKAP